MAGRDYYQILQVTHDAEPEVIDAAYKRLAFKYHPDRNPDTSSDKIMRDINEAYEIVGDPQKRKHYDEIRNFEQSIEQLIRYIHELLDQGKSSNDVIKKLIERGITHEAAAKLVGEIIELRRTSNSSNNKLAATTSYWNTWVKTNWHVFEKTKFGKLLYSNRDWLGTSAVAILVCFILYMYEIHYGKGQQLTFGNIEIYYKNGATEEDALKLRNFFMREKLFEGKHATFQLCGHGEGFEVRCVINGGVENDPKTVVGFEEFGHSISRECFQGLPVDIQLCDQKLNTLRAIPFQKDAPLFNNLKSSWDTGTFTHDFVLTNSSNSDLLDVELNIYLYRNDGECISVKKYWSNWKPFEEKKSNVAANNYQKVEVKGVATSGYSKVRIDASWTPNWN